MRIERAPWRATFPEDDPRASRRSVLLLGGLGAGAFLAGRVAGDTASAAPPAAAAHRGAGLPHPPAPPPPGTRAQEPFGSGALGNWGRSRHDASDAATDVAAAAGDGVHLLGDSIGARLLPVLRERFSPRPLSHDVWNGRPTAPALDRLADSAAAGRLAPTVLVVCGSNDVFDPWHLEEQIHRARAIVGQRRLVWVTPYVSRPSARSADMRNCAILGLALERAAADGTIELVRWFEFVARVAKDAEDYVEDGVHPTPRGAAALADLILATLG
ncbi:GDSL-type esterase/lipase family protein [Mobilicoccus pelagius]|uniref:SGNH hydrolase-type esterase domain-containing protein n=1 Tax=Mobilicoccus pelagius NBRC 104925 TaxID=1089455 RepID=H5UQ16_9MICO|nr:GDSL-type esterase/lipase family protein [Mobilicoccus pelagius]GAB47821.1 hypothetical protein MOPEL_029_01020 [Mobilicoccus pelagius NBRC 104925]